MFSLLNKLWIAVQIAADTENLVSGVKSLISAFKVIYFNFQVECDLKCVVCADKIGSVARAELP